MNLDCNQFQTINYLPNSNSSIERSASKLLAIRRPGDTADAASMCIVNALSTMPMIFIR